MRTEKKWTLIICVLIVSCTKQNSKDDYIPINAAVVPHSVALGQPIVARVNCGYYTSFADVRFLNFESKESAPRQYDIRARAHLSNINHSYELDVVMTFDTTFTLSVSSPGQYILKFYSPKDLVETDTVIVQ